MNGHLEQSNLHSNEFIFQCHLFVSKIKIVKWIVPCEIANHV